jgi:hypothetical protein
MGGTASSSGSSWVTSLRFPAGQRHGERDAVGVDHQVVLGACQVPELGHRV